MTEVLDDSAVHLGAHRLFDALSRWAEHNSTDPATAASDGVLTFAELAERTRALAATLTAEGAGPGTRVGLFLGRSRLGLPSLLAVWWVGATAVLVDERHPVDRLNLMLRDADVRVLLAQELPPGAAPRRTIVIRPDDAGPEPAGAPAGDGRPVVADPDECAYIVYTSGTTGWPKGVEVSYRNLATFLDALATVGLTPGGMGINAVSPAFDGWLWCALLYLLHGQGMAIVDLAGQDSTGDLTGLIERHAPRTVCLTPTLLSALDRVPSAEVVVVAGEFCPPALLKRLAGVDRVLNVYGPSETTIAATWADTARGDDPATIGRPLPGYAVYVLDEHRQPVAAGSAGELYVAGNAVAQGYRNRPELTAQRFLPDPFAGGDGRMYRTGDIVSARPDGQLEFRGRADDQVKVRGFRIELAEIERVAGEVHSVRAAAAFTVSTGDNIGLAVTTMPGTDPIACVARIRELCQSRLPDFMLPSVITVVATIPALPTGKVDRDELARTVRGTATGRGPRTERERHVCRVWSELLAHPVTDVEGNFFELGGHSLLAARSVGMLRRETGLPLSVRHLLAHPTAAALAAELDTIAVAADATTNDAVDIADAGHHGDVDRGGVDRDTAAAVVPARR